MFSPKCLVIFYYSKKRASAIVIHARPHFKTNALKLYSSIDRYTMKKGLPRNLFFGQSFANLKIKRLLQLIRLQFLQLSQLRELSNPTRCRTKRLLLLYGHLKRLLISHQL